MVEGLQDNFIPTKADMDHCPLCLNKWLLVEEKSKTGRVYLTCLRDKCMISIWIRDPMLARWTRIEKEPCPNCSEPMRMFCRSDGYIKVLCPKCFLSMENVDPAKHAKLMKEEEARGIRKIYKSEEGSETL